MNRHQQYMQRALQDIDAVPSGLRDDYTSLCRALPSLVLTNGLALTVCFLKSKAKEGGPHQLVLTHLEHILETADLERFLAQGGTDRYMAATFSVLDAWVFYKRFAQSLIDDSSSSPTDHPPAMGPAIVEGVVS